MEVTQIRRLRADGLHLARLVQDGADEAFLTLHTLPGEDPATLLHRLYGWLTESPQWRILRQDVYGVSRDGLGRGIHRLSGSDWPETWVMQGAEVRESPVAGLQIHAVAGVRTRRIQVGGRTVGMLFEDGRARCCSLGGIRSTDVRRSREEQTAEVFELIEQALGSVGMTFANVFRTWFYLDRILEWYDGFNEVRNAFFRRRGVYDGLVPASTGIGGSNVYGSALIADVLAMESLCPELSVVAVPSPLQCPAPDYGSAFSRAVEFRRPGQRRLLISGTASIAPGGETLHVGDLDAQIATTLDVIEGILESRDFRWSDCVRAIGYFKQAADIPAFGRHCASRAIRGLPVVLTHNDVCRDELLFELELDVIRGVA